MLVSQGKLEEAGPLYKRSLDIRESVLGPGHPAVAASLNDLAGLLKAQVTTIRQFEESSCRTRLCWCAVLSTMGGVVESGTICVEYLFRCPVDVLDNQAGSMQGTEWGIPSVHGVLWIYLYSCFVVNDESGNVGSAHRSRWRSRRIIW